eukprot:PhF_6_TR13513/c0_g1_i2/m.21592
MSNPDDRVAQIQSRIMDVKRRLAGGNPTVSGVSLSLGRLLPVPHHETQAPAPSPPRSGDLTTGGGYKGSENRQLPTGGKVSMSALQDQIVRLHSQISQQQSSVEQHTKSIQNSSLQGMESSFQSGAMNLSSITRGGVAPTSPIPLAYPSNANIPATNKYIDPSSYYPSSRRSAVEQEHSLPFAESPPQAPAVHAPSVAQQNPFHHEDTNSAYSQQPPSTADHRVPLPPVGYVHPVVISTNELMDLLRGRGVISTLPPTGAILMASNDEGGVNDIPQHQFLTNADELAQILQMRHERSYHRVAAPQRTERGVINAPSANSSPRSTTGGRKTSVVSSNRSTPTATTRKPPSSTTNVKHKV